MTKPTYKISLFNRLSEGLESGIEMRDVRQGEPSRVMKLSETFKIVVVIDPWCGAPYDSGAAFYDACKKWLDEKGFAYDDIELNDKEEYSW